MLNSILNNNEDDLNGPTDSKRKKNYNYNFNNNINDENKYNNNNLRKNLIPKKKKINIDNEENTYNNYNNNFNNTNYNNYKSEPNYNSPNYIKKPN